MSIVAVDVFDLICVLCLFTERLQMSLHVRVPPEAAAAGLRGPEQVHGLFLRVSSLMKKKEKHVHGVFYTSRFYSCLLFLTVSSKMSSWSCSGDVSVSPDSLTSSRCFVQQQQQQHLETSLIHVIVIFHLQGPNVCTTTSSTMNTSATESTST